MKPFSALSHWAGRLTPYPGVFLRAALGWVFLRHGIVKLGMGVAGVAGFFGGLGIPAPHVSAVIIMTVETVGAVCLLVGMLTRFWAAMMALDMIVAILVAVLPSGHGFELTAVRGVAGAQGRAVAVGRRPPPAHRRPAGRATA